MPNLIFKGHLKTKHRTDVDFVANTHKNYLRQILIFIKTETIMNLKQWALILITSILITGCNNAGGSASNIKTLKLNNSSEPNQTLHKSTVTMTATMNTVWSVDGFPEDVARSQLHDLGWHLITITVTKVDNNTQSTPVGGLQYIIGDNSKQQHIEIEDINCNNAVFSKYGDSCSAYFRMDYARDLNDLSSVPFSNIEIATNAYPNIPHTFALNTRVDPKISVLNLRKVSPVESKYFLASELITNPKQYHIVLVQNASINSINIESIINTNSNIFSLVTRNDGITDDSVYGKYKQCLIANNTESSTSTTLNELNDSCLLIYRSSNVGTKTIESSTVTLGSNAITKFPEKDSTVDLSQSYLVTCATNDIPDLNNAQAMCSNYAQKNGLKLNINTTKVGSITLSSDQKTCSVDITANFHTINPIYYTCADVFTERPVATCRDSTDTIWLRFVNTTNGPHWASITQHDKTCSAVLSVSGRCKPNANCTPKDKEFTSTCNGDSNSSNTFTRPASSRGGEKVEQGSRSCGNQTWNSTFIN